MFADDEGGSHFEHAELSPDDFTFIPQAPPVHVANGKPVDNMVFMGVPTGQSDDGHTAP